MNDGKSKERIWDQYLTARDKEVFKTSGFGAKGGFGKRPALLVIDVSWGFAGDKPEPILDSIKRWSNSCGAESWEAIAAIKELAGAFRERKLPVIYTTGVTREDGWDIGSWAWKNTRTGESVPRPTQTLDANEIVSEIAPQPQDLVVLKQKPSGFFGTPLALVSAIAGRRQRHRNRHDHVRLRARDGAGRLQPQLPRRRGRGRMLRPLAGKSRNKLVRHACKVCRRGAEL